MARLVRTLAVTPPCGPVDCAELACWNITRPLVQQVFAPTPLWLTCDFSTAGGGWTIMQLRRDPNLDFYRMWSEYKHGFGVRDTFWLGLDHVHRLTKDKATILRVELQMGHPPHTKHIEYEGFSVLSEAHQFLLQLRGPTGDKTLPEALMNHTGPFCTRDSPDSAFCRGEASNFHTGWWFSPEHARLGADLNSKMRSRIRQERVYWRGVRDIKTTAMKFRPLSFVAGQQNRSCDNTCPNGGTCRRNAYGRFHCDCAPGYGGRQCLLRKNGKDRESPSAIRYVQIQYFVHTGIRFVRDNFARRDYMGAPRLVFGPRYVRIYLSVGANLCITTCNGSLVDLYGTSLGHDTNGYTDQ